MVRLQMISIRTRNRNSAKQEITLAQFNQEEQEVIKYLNLTEEDIKNLTKTTFKSAEEYFQLFFKNQEILENYLLFLQ